MGMANDESSSLMKAMNSMYCMNVIYVNLKVVPMGGFNVVKDATRCPLVNSRNGTRPTSTVPL